MLFNSFAFELFLPLVFVVHWWWCRTQRAQNVFLIGASYVFYGWWDWRFCLLLLASSLSDFAFGIHIDAQQDAVRRKRALVASIVFNLGILAFFKYFDFFVDSAADLLRAFGLQPNPWSLRVILPVGISFYTFQSMSYTIEVYRRNCTPVRDPLAYLAFVSFFPHMVAGPIMRAVDLLPQFQRKRTFSMDKARDGARQMLWGFFKKIAVADTCAGLADTVFAQDARVTSGVTLFFGALCFAFQIYADFSGYSDIAIGCARFFGVDLMRNFDNPYFSRSIGEFWRRWHISLSGWFRDFVYLPLGGNRVRGRRVRNILITFAASGLWHGANWTFLCWGLLHGSYYVPEVLTGQRTRKEHASWRDLPRILWVFGLVLIGWVFFRAATVQGAVDHLRFTVMNAPRRPFELWDWLGRSEWIPVVLLFALEWRARREQHALAVMPSSVVLRWAIYLLLVLTALLYLQLYSEHAFIYFRF